MSKSWSRLPLARVLWVSLVVPVLLGTGPCEGNVNDEIPGVPFTSRVSVRTDGAEADKTSGALSGGGQGSTTGSEHRAAVSEDGRFVAFVSSATNLVDGDTNGKRDVFWRDTVAGITKRVSIRSDGTQVTGDDCQYPDISPDGHHVTFASNGDLGFGASGTSRAYIHHVDTGVTEHLSGGFTPIISWAPRVSRDGLFAVFASSAGQVYRRNVGGGTTDLVSVTSTGANANNSSNEAAISADGRFVAFYSSSTNLDSAMSGGSVYRRDMSLPASGGGAQKSIAVVSISWDGSTGATGCDFPAISGDGRFVSMSSTSTIQHPDDTSTDYDIIVRDMNATVNANILASRADGPNGPKATGADFSHLSGDGRYVVFVSLASNLVLGDTNRAYDVFMRDIVGGRTVVLPVSTQGTQGDFASDWPMISGDGRFVVFYSEARNLVDNDTNGLGDIFIRGPGPF